MYTGSASAIRGHVRLSKLELGDPRPGLKEEYPRFWLGRQHGGWTSAYRLIYRWEQGLIRKGWTIDHACGEKDCLDHLEAVTRAENLRRRHARARGELPTGHAGLVPPRRAA